ncbi:helix-turn-helix domain-containing protein [Glacieibacterium megasporae]|uniref:helix-turn-helix domain-containing protein n=1 Tax=Glacieibacterium megasporae TaxID=2835787 RepID=UPI0034E2ED76
MSAEREANPAVARMLQERSRLRGDKEPLADALPASRGRMALTEAQQVEIIQRVVEGTSMSTDLALEFGVHKSTISRVLRGPKAPSVPVVIKIDAGELGRRVSRGVAKATASGNRRGPKPKLSTEIQNAIGEAATFGKESLASLAQTYGVAPSTISRIVRSHRQSRSEHGSQSLEEMFHDIRKI